jgi:hypothetical protein
LGVVGDDGEGLNVTQVSRIANVVLDDAGNPVPGCQVTVTLLTPQGVGGAFRVDDGTEVAPVIQAVTDQNGLWFANLEQTANISPAGTFYQVSEYIPSTKASQFAPQGVRIWLIQVGALGEMLSAAQVLVPPTSTGATVPVFLTQATGDARYVLAPASFSGSVTNSAPGDVANAGVASSYSRGDHKHGREASSLNWQCAVYQNGALSIQNGNIDTVVAFDSIVEDPSSMYNTSTGTFTVPAGAGGRWLIEASVTWTSAASGVCFINIDQPPGTERMRGLQPNLASAPNPVTTIIGILRLTAGSQFTITLAQTGPNNPQALSVGRANVRCETQWLGP